MCIPLIHVYIVLKLALICFRNLTYIYLIESILSGLRLLQIFLNVFWSYVTIYIISGFDWCWVLKDIPRLNICCLWNKFLTYLSSKEYIYFFFCRTTTYFLSVRINMSYTHIYVFMVRLQIFTNPIFCQRIFYNYFTIFL